MCIVSWGSGKKFMTSWLRPSNNTFLCVIIFHCQKNSCFVRTLSKVPLRFCFFCFPYWELVNNNSIHSFKLWCHEIILCRCRLYNNILFVIFFFCCFAFIFRFWLLKSFFYYCFTAINFIHSKSVYFAFFELFSWAHSALTGNYENIYSVRFVFFSSRGSIDNTIGSCATP